MSTTLKDRGCRGSGAGAAFGRGGGGTKMRSVRSEGLLRTLSSGTMLAPVPLVLVSNTHFFAMKLLLISRYAKRRSDTGGASLTRYVTCAPDGSGM
jgi:hypothetical protein